MPLRNVYHSLGNCFGIGVSWANGSKGDLSGTAGALSSRILHADVESSLSAGYREQAISSNRVASLFWPSTNPIDSFEIGENSGASRVAAADRRRTGRPKVDSEIHARDGRPRPLCRRVQALLVG